MKLPRIVCASAVTGALLFLSGVSNALELTAAHVNPPGEPTNIAFAELAKRLESSKTGLEMKVFPQGQVGGEKDAIEQVKIGAISMTAVGTGSLGNFAKTAGVYNLPFLFRDSHTHPWIVADGEVGKEIEEKIEKEAGVEILGWWSAGMRHLFTSEDKVVKTPEDLDGLKIRVMGVPAHIDTINALGGKATPMAYGEVYTGLATGALDGAENDSSGYRNKKFFEHAPNYTLTGHAFLFKPVIANKSVIDSMSEEQKAEFDEIFAEVTAMQRELFNTNFDTDIAWLEEQGVKVHQPDSAAFQKLAAPVRDQHAEDYGKDLVDRIVNAK